MAKIRLGTFLAPAMVPVYQAIADAIGERMGATTELVVETDYENCVNDVNDICFVCSLPYVMFEREGASPAVPIAAPVLAGRRYGGKPIYFSDVIVHRDSDAASFLDLRGRSWAYNEPLSQSGYGVTRYHLVSLGETQGFFSEVIQSGFHETSIRMVAAGEVDASAIDSQVLAIGMRDKPELQDQIRIIEALGPSTIQPVAVSRRFDDKFRAQVRDVLVHFADDDHGRRILNRGLIERWVAVGPSDYDDIRAMVEACEAADFMEIR
ncbi:MAG: PhnD/SsuA/transferrin family substrate-binding protein [Acidimicrobiia bacterium]|nr:PhnD/SsuA/transferrin family substrate-binding protein [Acidimicrobiia bacterium]